MVDIFKWFAGVVVVIILAYLVVTGIRIFGSKFNFTSSTTTGSTTGTANNATTTVVDWFKNYFKPIPYVAGGVVLENQTQSNQYQNPIADKLLSFYKDWNVSIPDGSDDFDERWSGKQHILNESTNSQGKGSSYDAKQKIKLNLNQNSVLKNNQVLTGKADRNSYSDKIFYITVLDGNKKVLGTSKMFVNGSQASDGTIPFRGVLIFNNTNSSYGYLQVKDDDKNLIKVNFDRISAISMPKLLYTSPQNDSCVVAGCSMQFCVEQGEAQRLVSTCEYKREYQCYRYATCERDLKTGRCGWRVDSTLASCLQNS